MQSFLKAVEDRLHCPCSCVRELKAPSFLPFQPPVPPDLVSPRCIEAVTVLLQNPDLKTSRLGMLSFSLYLAREDR